MGPDHRGSDSNLGSGKASWRKPLGPHLQEELGSSSCVPAGRREGQRLRVRRPHCPRATDCVTRHQPVGGSRRDGICVRGIKTPPELLRLCITWPFIHLSPFGGFPRSHKMPRAVIPQPATRGAQTHLPPLLLHPWKMAWQRQEAVFQRFWCP